MKNLNYFLLPLLFIAALIVFTVLIFPLSSFKVAGVDFISIWLIILITTISSLVALMVFLFLSGAEKRSKRGKKLIFYQSVFHLLNKKFLINRFNTTQINRCFNRAIKGKSISAGKDNWIWWSKEAFG